MYVVVFVVADAGVRRSASLEEVHQSEVDALTGQRVDHPRTAGGPDCLAAAAVDLNRRRTGDESSLRACC